MNKEQPEEFAVQEWKTGVATSCAVFFRFVPFPPPRCLKRKIPIAKDLTGFPSHFWEVHNARSSGLMVIKPPHLAVPRRIISNLSIIVASRVSAVLNSAATVKKEFSICSPYRFYGNTTDPVESRKD
jgi:hypothetical protein